MFADPKRSGVADVARLAGTIQKIVDDKSFADVPSLPRWQPRVARFSFETGAWRVYLKTQYDNGGHVLWNCLD